jgi:hypothetical protein
MHRLRGGTRYKVENLFLQNLFKEITHFSPRANRSLNGPRKVFSEYAFTVEFVDALASAFSQREGIMVTWPTGTSNFFHAQFVHDIGANRTRDTRREVSGTVAGELIIVFGDFGTNRWKLRKNGLSTDVDKPVSNSNLNHDFRLRTDGAAVRFEQGVKE